MQLAGIHHLTAITADVARNHAFYTRTLGLRLAKKSVNQDDVSAYHLFYTDGIASPGSDITFFDWPVPPDGGDGTHRVVIEGSPRIEVSVEATAEGGNRAAGGNATAANRLVNAIPWLREAEPGLYDGLEVPLSPATGRLGRKHS